MLYRIIKIILKYEEVKKKKMKKFNYKTPDHRMYCTVHSILNYLTFYVFSFLFVNRFVKIFTNKLYVREVRDSLIYNKISQMTNVLWRLHSKTNLLFYCNCHNMPLIDQWKSIAFIVHKYILFVNCSSLSQQQKFMIWYFEI